MPRANEEEIEHGRAACLPDQKEEDNRSTIVDRTEEINKLCSSTDGKNSQKNTYDKHKYSCDDNQCPQKIGNWEILCQSDSWVWYNKLTQEHHNSFCTIEYLVRGKIVCLTL